ncbi:sugar phosphate isomerase/epimerase [Chitinophaga sp. MM2321]|uniref:sugar phosphate isomerase/epimerase family protein n=1 Tax=Chitinophaga sp. MM2321 TaxID=3137178 RepID=UPI0032D58679
MEILFFCPRWGSENLSWDIFCEKAKDEGFDGVEAAIPFEPELKDEVLKALTKHSLQLIGQYYQSFEKNFAEHKTSYEKHLANLLSVKPLKIDAQTGKDYFTIAQNKILFDLATKMSLESGIPIAHETHRNKALFAAHSTEKILQEIPGLTITADFSHWCNVAESLLEDQEDAMDLACKHAIHIHARVGYEQGPQINDPRAPEWEKQLNAHLEWWDCIIKQQRQQGALKMTITPEFGPIPYMQTLPFSQTPVASQWDINVYMMQLLKRRYQQ